MSSAWNDGPRSIDTRITGVGDGSAVPQAFGVPGGAVLISRVLSRPRRMEPRVPAREPPLSRPTRTVALRAGQGNQQGGVRSPDRAELAWHDTARQLARTLCRLEAACWGDLQVAVCVGAATWRCDTMAAVCWRCTESWSVIWGLPLARTPRRVCCGVRMPTQVSHRCQLAPLRLLQALEARREAQSGTSLHCSTACVPVAGQALELVSQHWVLLGLRCGQLCQLDALER